MPKIRLSAGFVRRAASTGARKTDYFDDRLPGFLLEVRATGGKTYYQRYRDSHGRERQYKIGSADVLTVQEARRKARSIAADAALGNDPQKTRQELRAIPTLTDFAQKHYLPFARDAKRSWRTDETILRLHILPALGSCTLDDIDDKKIGVLLRDQKRRGYSSGTTNRTTILLRYMFNQARRWGLPGPVENPAAGFRIEPDVCRERFLSPEERRRLFAALDVDENKTAAAAIRFLLLTGGRRNEVTHARWDYVDWKSRTLLVPLSKSGKPRYIILSEAALDVLRSMQKLSNDSFYIFPSDLTGRPCPSLHFPWSRIRKRAGLEDVRLHDLRHSFASHLVNNKVDIYTVQKMLGHRSVKTTQRYAHLTEETLAEAAEIASRES